MSSTAIAQSSMGEKEAGMKEIREPVFAGEWYPGQSDILSRDIRQYLQNVKEGRLEGEVIALVSPHAGYMFSGQVAAHVYKLIEGKSFDAIVAIGPSHRFPFKGASL